MKTYTDEELIAKLNLDALDEATQDEGLDSFKQIVNTRFGQMASEVLDEATMDSFTAKAGEDIEAAVEWLFTQQPELAELYEATVEQTLEEANS